MIRLSGILLVIIFMFQFLGCNSIRKLDNKKRIEYSNNYLVVNVIFSKAKRQIVMMNGVGDKKDLSKLNTESVDNFLKSFYVNYAYSPIIIDLEISYKRFVNCFGYDMDWYNKYYLNDLTDDLESVCNIELDDGFYVNVRYYRLLNDIEIKYVENDVDLCLYDVSIEGDLKKKVGMVKRVALFLNKN